MTTVTELISLNISLKIHKVEQHKSSYVITLYYPSMPSEFSVEGENLFNIVNSLIQSNGLNMDDVTIYYYSKMERIEDIYECSFDIYNSRYIGHRVTQHSIFEMSDTIYELHRRMIQEILDY